jgi:hypothetical protein
MPAVYTTLIGSSLIGYVATYTPSDINTTMICQVGQLTAHQGFGVQQAIIIHVTAGYIWKRCCQAPAQLHIHQG